MDHSNNFKDLNPIKHFKLLINIFPNIDYNLNISCLIEKINMLKYVYGAL